MPDVMPLTANRQGNIASVKYLFESTYDNLIANPGGGQGGATQIASEIARFTVVATSGDSAQLPPARPGLTIICTNHGAQPLQMYGNGTDTVDDQVSVTQMVNSVVIYACTSIGKWYANGLGTGFAGAFETQSYVDALTAHAGGGQNLAPIIATMISRFTVVATTGDSTTLPVAMAGMNVTTINASANSMNVFPDSGSTINALSATFALAAGKTAVFVTTVPGAWHTIPLVP
jgi:hypothetical protein